MATLRPKWFLISPVLTASGAFSDITWKRSGTDQLRSRDSRCILTFNTHDESLIDVCDVAASEEKR